MVISKVMIIINKTDSIICSLDNFLKTVYGNLSGTGRINPGDKVDITDLTTGEKKISASLMRVNHAGEVAAQALYQGQMLFERNKNMVMYFSKAAEEEADHLNWTSNQIDKLNSHKSYLNFLWYGGAFLLGATAALSGEKKSLGFLAETERQVEEHLQGHLKVFPKNDKSSRLVIEEMLRDEAEHADWAENSKNFVELPKTLKKFMKQGAKLMVFVSQRI